MLRGSGLATLFFLACTLAGCANDQATINRVQPNALSKAMFVGEWYTKGTVIDTQIDAPIYVGSEMPFDRIEWEIQEKFLIAKRSYEFVRGAEEDGITDGEKTSVVAVYAISSHFDIRREYNPATGERSNVVVENTLDRPWSEREFMRVDWSQNLLDDGLLSSPYAGSIPIKNVALFDQNTGDTERAEFAPKFEQDQDGDVVYFDLVNRYWAEPALSPNGYYPACYDYGNSQADCSPGAVAVRHSYMRVEDRDYQPRPYTQDRMERFGYFLVKRDNYDDSYGATVAGREVYAMRHNLWQESHRRVEGKTVECTTDAQCGGSGSECDRAWGRARNENAGACTIPYHRRELRAIRYYLTSNFPTSLLSTALKVGQDWDRAFTETVASMMRLDCDDAGGADCTTFVPEQIASRLGPVFAICRNPVTADDAPGCGEPGFSPRFGDIRYNFVSWVSDAHSRASGAPLGLGPSAADPLTGEVVSGVANLYGDGFDQVAAQGRDILAMMQGDLSETDTHSSAAFSAWLTHNDRAAVAQTSSREADRHVVQLDVHDMAEANADMDFSWATKRLPVFQAPMGREQIRDAAPAQWKRIGAMHDTLNIATKGASKLSALSGSWIEDLMVDDGYASALGLAPGTPLTADQIKQVSPVGGQGAFGTLGAQRAREAALRSDSNQRACLVQANDFMDEGLLGLLKEIDRAVNEGDGTLTWYGTKYDVGTRGAIDYEQVKEMLKQPLLYGLMAHELGHTLGLRHNFSGSYDALNYRPGYWELRDDGKIASRAEDPMSDAEINGRIREYQYSTVMDYGNNSVVSDSQGLGHYDVAAIKMGYGDLAEVFTDAPQANAVPIASIDAQASSFMVFQVDPPRSQTDQEFRAFHYSSWPALLGGVANIQKRKDVRYRDLGFVASPLFGGGGRGIYQEGEALLPVVPYLYCGDEFADSRPPCNRYDAGADPYEVMQSIIDSYWNYYPFSHFMRGRIGWDSNSVMNRSWGRYYSPLISMSQIYALYRQLFEPFLGKTFFEDSNGFGLYTLGVRATYDLFRRVVATPEPGSLGYERLVDGTPLLSEDGTEEPTIPKAIDAFNGRYLPSYGEVGPSSEWIFNISSGWFQEKALALQALTYAGTGYLGIDTSTDIRRYSSSFYTIFPDSMGSYLSSIFASNYAAYSPRLLDGTLYYPSPDEIVNQGMAIDAQGADRVSPSLVFSLQLQAMVAGMLEIPNNFDQDFVNRSRVFVEGSSEAVTPANPVTYTDDRSGLVYVAGSYPVERDGKTVETGSGAAMIAFANALKANVVAAQLAGDADTASRTQAELTDFVDNLDVLRFLSNELGHGSDGDF